MILSMFYTEQDKQIQQLLEDYPNPHMRVVGAGTVRMDPEKIRDSAEYKAFVVTMKEFSKRS